MKTGLSKPGAANTIYKYFLNLSWKRSVKCLTWPDHRSLEPGGQAHHHLTDGPLSQAGPFGVHRTGSLPGLTPLSKFAGGLWCLPSWGTHTRTNTMPPLDIFKKSCLIFLFSELLFKSAPQTKQATSPRGQSSRFLSQTQGASHYSRG